MRARHGAVLAYYHSGGVIPNRGYYQIRHADSHAAIGELDEEFVWEASVGQVFALGTRHWQITRSPTTTCWCGPPTARPPRRRSGAPRTVSRSFHFSRHVSAFLRRPRRCSPPVTPTRCGGRLMAERGFDHGAADELTTT
jgi:ATP-dependent helicase Lhr and Lhr-like helicase